MEQDFEIMLLELKEEDGPFDEMRLQNLRSKLWKIADKYGTDGADIFSKFMDWVSENNKSFK